MKKACQIRDFIEAPVLYPWKTKDRPRLKQDGLLFCAVALYPYTAGGSATALGLPLLDMSTTSSFL